MSGLFHFQNLGGTFLLLLPDYRSYLPVLSLLPCCTIALTSLSLLPDYLSLLPREHAKRTNVVRHTKHLSSCHPVILSSCHPLILSSCQSVSSNKNEPIIKYINHFHQLHFSLLITNNSRDHYYHHHHYYYHHYHHYFSTQFPTNPETAVSQTHSPHPNPPAQESRPSHSRRCRP